MPSQHIMMPHQMTHQGLVGLAWAIPRPCKITLSLTNQYLAKANAGLGACQLRRCPAAPLTTV